MKFLTYAPGWLAFSVYAATLSPTVGLEWSGMLVTAADYWGVPIPPGYPVWTVLAGLFTRIFSGVTYHGHPNPAWGVGLMSSVFGALTVANVASLVRRAHGGAAADHLPAAIAGASASLILAFSHTFWSKCVVAEPVTLYLFLLTLFLRLGLRWMQEGRPCDAYALAVTGGYGLLTSPAFAVAVAIAPFFIVSAGKAALRRIRPGPLVVALIAGLLPLAYLPIAASQNPPMNYGYARTWEGFLHVISRGQFERLDPVANYAYLVGNPEQIIVLLTAIATHLAAQFRLPLLTLALVGFVCATRGSGIRRTWHGLLALLFTAYVVSILIVQCPKTDIQTIFIARVAWLPLSILSTLFMGTALFSYIRRLLRPSSAMGTPS